MQEHTLSVYRTARYCTLGEPSDPVDEVWMVCHGYGQLAPYFLRSFRAVEAPHRLVVAPEGLSRFYGVDHKYVGASWMTREAREDEIEDYVRLLDTVHTDVLTRARRPRVRLVALGFSQGGATVTRWLARSPMLGDPPADRLVLWGSVLPHDLDLDEHGAWLRRVGLTLVVGDADTYATPERIAEQERRLREAQVPFESVRFDGEHRLDADVLRGLAG
ncbi:MAG: esterase [Bacteroidota bacterium]